MPSLNFQFNTISNRGEYHGAKEFKTRPYKGESIFGCPTGKFLINSRTTRLFRQDRQEQLEDWKYVVSRVAAELKNAVG